MTGHAVRDPRHSRAGTHAYVWGYNNTAELGIGHAARAFRPQPVSFEHRFVDLQGGANYSVALTSSGQVWTWGANEHGQLGDGTRAGRPKPRRIRLPRDAQARAISAGTDHVLVLTTDGGVIVWGRTGTSGRVTAIRAGHRHSLALTDRREVLAWGDGRYGAVGGGRPKPDASTVATPQRVAVPEGAVTTRLGGGGYTSAVFVEHGPAVGLTLTPSETTTIPGRPVRYQVHAVDAFGTDLGPASGSVTLTATGATVRGTTVTAHQLGAYSISARAGSLLGRATLHVTKDSHR